MSGSDPSYVYIIANKRHGTLYTGVTKFLSQRVHQHKTGEIRGFTSRYGLHMLVYYEVYDALENAVQREKRIKEWKRQWKIELIEKMNPEWRDLYEQFNQ